MKCSLGISHFLEENSSLSHSIVFSISLHWSLRKAFLSLLIILWNYAFKWVYFSFSPFLSLLFFSQLFVSPPQTTILHFFFLGMVLVTSSCTMSRTSVHSSSGICLSDLIPWINLSFLLYKHKEFDLGHTWMVYWFTFLQFKSEFCNKEFMISFIHCQINTCQPHLIFKRIQWCKLYKTEKL